MSRVLKALVAVGLITTLALPAWSQVPGPPPPVPPGAAPAWTVVPSSPRVLYAPNVPGDVFRVKQKYYYYYGGVWYRSKSLWGPWRPMRKPPKALLRVNRTFFKSTPPW